MTRRRLLRAVLFLLGAVASVAARPTAPVWAATTAASSAASKWTRTVNFRWDAHPDDAVVGYRLYTGRSTGSYNFSVDLGLVTTTSATITGRGLWVFALTAWTMTDESNFSTEARYTVA